TLLASDFSSSDRFQGGLAVFCWFLFYIFLYFSILVRLFVFTRQQGCVIIHLKAVFFLISTVFF
ncbi:hypothetical protein ACLBPU_31125, partial [Klebsiella pneumoniae]